MSKKIWYAKMSGGGCQGIVIDEETGETVAVSYSPSNRHLIASAPDLQKSLRGIVSILEELREKTVINMCFVS